MKTNFSLLFYLKKPKIHQKEAVPVYMRITVNGKRAEIATGRECEPTEWNTGCGRAKGTKERVKSFNAYLDGLQTKVYDAHRAIIDTGDEVTADSIKNKFLGKSEESQMLIDIFKEHNLKMAALVDREYAPGTLLRYETSLRHTQNFLEWKYKVSDIDIRKIDHHFITEFEFYLRSVRKCANNSAVKYVRNFGKIIHICIANRWLTYDPFLISNLLSLYFIKLSI